MSILSKCVYFLYFLSSSLAFYFWGQKSLIVLFVVNLLSIVLLKKYIKIRALSANDFYIIISFVFIILWSFLSRGITQCLLDVFRYFPILCFCLLPDYKCEDFYKFIDKLLKLFLSGSLIIYFYVSFLNGDLPNLGVIDSGTERHSLFINYLLYIEPQYDYQQILPRFNAFFLEPGHLGMICAFMLFGNRFNFKDAGNYIYLLSLFFSLSLAGYLLSLLGFIFLNIRKLNRIIPFLFIIIIVVLFSIKFNDGDNVFNDLIIERIQIDDDAISRNSRTSDELNNYYANYMHVKEYLIGIDNTTFRRLQSFNVNGAGYKIYILNYGIIGILLMAVFYSSIAVKLSYRRSSMAFLFILAFAFIQRAYPWWFSWILPFYGEELFVNNKHKNTK